MRLYKNSYYTKNYNFCQIIQDFIFAAICSALSLPVLYTFSLVCQLKQQIYQEVPSCLRTSMDSSIEKPALSCTVTLQAAQPGDSLIIILVLVWGQVLNLDTT